MVVYVLKGHDFAPRRKLVEKVFGWAKQDRAARQVKFRGRARVDGLFRLLATAHNLLRMQKLIPAQ